MHPRRVVGGIRLQARLAAGLTSQASDASTPAPPGWTWASSRWMRLAETFAPGEQLAEGLAYAQSGQTRSIEIRPGMVSGRIQGRMPTAYKTSLRLPTFDHEQWERVIGSMAGQARFAASILAGELPPNVEDLFAPHGLKLFPADPHDLSTSCTCAVFTGLEPPGVAMRSAIPGEVPGTRTTTPWCKHVCCLMYLVAERVGQDSLLMLALRGMPAADMVERLRQARTLAGLQRGPAAGAGDRVDDGHGPRRAPAGAAPIYAPHIAIGDQANQPLGECIHGFWSAPDPEALERLDCPIAPPEVSHPLLRRLGPSPFSGVGARFPLVGLLATCYDVISAEAIRAPDRS